MELLLKRYQKKAVRSSVKAVKKYCPASEECMATDENVRCTECEYLCKTCGRCELKEEKDFGHDCGQECKECGFACTKCGCCTNPMLELQPGKHLFSDGKFSDTRNSETGAEEYTIPASNAFGLPHRFPVCQSSGSLSGRIPETLRKKFTIWRNRRHEENDFICCRNICRKCGRCNCNVHFTGEQKISEGERKWQVLI